MNNNSCSVGTFFSLSHYAVHKFRIPGHSICDKRSGRATASVYYIVSGSVDFDTPQGPLHAESGDMLYIPRRQRYTANWTGCPDIVFYGIDYGFDVKSEFGFVGGNTAVYDNYLLQKPDKTIFGDAETVFESLYNKYCNPDTLGFEAVTDFYVFFGKLLSVLDKTVLTTPDSPVEKAALYIEQHATEDFYMDDLAKMCGISTSRFYTLFREYMGLTPVEYKNTIRIRMARKMLESGKSSDEISEMLGFSSAAYFRKVFESVTGMLPGTYKKNASGYGEKKVLL